MPTQSGKTLFSPHYLETRLPALPEWGADCSAAFAQLKALFESKRAILPTLNESQTEQEFVKPALEVLRQPLEDKTVTISRAQGSLTFPANFVLVGAMNPCPCGFLLRQ